MATKKSKNDLVKQIIKQISGNVTEDDELLPEVAIEGSGDVWLGS